MNLADQAKSLPLSPGVYIWLDKENKPLYVGRATSLRSRVLQYFRKDIDSRIGEMVGLAKKIKYHQTPSVLEAIILEANLIKKYWPKYNVKDKDNRSFVYIVFPKTDFPKPIVVRGRELESFPASTAKIFGPYQSTTLVRNALKVIRRIFPYSTCKPNSKPCFDYQVGLCPGVCVGAISKEDYNEILKSRRASKKENKFPFLLTPSDYQKNINNIMMLLRGEKNRLLKKLSKENPAAALALKHFQDVTLITREDFVVGEQKFNRIEGYDISHFAGKEVYGSMVVFTGGKPDKAQYRLFKIRTVGNNDLDALKEMMERRLRHAEWPKPDLILIDGGKPQVDYIYKVTQQFQVAAPMLGISKLNGDRLVFPAGTKNVFKDLAETIKRTLQGVRDEAHRFANRGRSHRYFKDNLGA